MITTIVLNYRRAQYTRGYAATKTQLDRSSIAPIQGKCFRPHQDHLHLHLVHPHQDHHHHLTHLTIYNREFCAKLTDYIDYFNTEYTRPGCMIPGGELNLEM